MLISRSFKGGNVGREEKRRGEKKKKKKEKEKKKREMGISSVGAGWAG